jgi:amino acid permease
MRRNDNQPFWISFAFTLNSALGVSVLSVPYAFSRAGIFFGSLIQITSFLVSLILSFQVLQAWSRVGYINELKARGAKVRPVPFINILKNKSEHYIEQIEDSSNDELDNLLESKSSESDLKKYEFSEIVRDTMGSSASHVLCVIYIIHMFFGLISSCSILATCMASNIPLFTRETCNLYDHEGFFNECKISYWIYLGAFIALNLILCFFHVIHTKTWQSFACAARFLVFLIMIVTSIVAICISKEFDDDADLKASPETFDISQYGRLFSIIFNATLYHNTIPITASFMENKEKNLAKLVTSVGIISHVLILSISVLANYAADDVEKLILLNWREYTAGHSDNDRPWWCYIIIYCVVLLPAANVTSSYPIICSSLAANTVAVIDHDDEEYVIAT